MSELREKFIEWNDKIGYSDEEEQFRESVSVTDDLLAPAFYAGYMTAINTPKHETVEEWEKRTGESYPDDGPVWYYEDNRMGEVVLYSWELATWDDVQELYTGCIVANHHGKPEIGE